MMNFLSRLRKPVMTASAYWINSKTVPGVRFAVREPSLDTRIALVKRLQELTRKNEFLAAGDDMDRLELSLAELLLQRELVLWGLLEITGLRIDGKRPDGEVILRHGPEELAVEIAATVKSRCGLSDEERKN